MNATLFFTRFLFIILSMFFGATYMTALNWGNFLTGSIMGLAFGVMLIGLDLIFKKSHLRSFNLTTLGLFFGYLMGKGLTLIFETALKFAPATALQPQVIGLLQLGLFLFGIYLGTILTIRSANEFYISLPFIKLTAPAYKKKDLLIDSSILADSRIIDLAACGLIDNHLIIPRFIVKDLFSTVENGDETNKAKARRSLDTLKKLEGVSGFEIRYSETDFPEITEQTNKLVKLARLNSAHILTADISKVQMAAIEGIKIINLHTLANAFKPLMQAGENLKIKVQRYGKEPNQGVGYLEDGTMVVVNGGGDFIGQGIEAQVLSVKHTTSGRIIFCNAQEEALAQKAVNPYETYE